MSSLVLDAEAEGTLSDLAERWSVTKEEALKKALILADQASQPDEVRQRIAAFRELEAALKMDRAKAEAWKELLQNVRR
jgi:hypothetical protein